MTEKRIPAGENTVLTLHDLAGNLVVNAWAEPEILVTAQGEIETSEDGDGISLTCSQDCSLTIPADFSLRFGRLSADAQIAGVAGNIEGRSVGGDLHLQRTGSAKIDAVSGNMTACHITGDLDVRRVGGDLAVDTLQGHLSASVGGDLKVLALAGGINASAGGDVNLEFHSLPAGKHAAQASGDMACRLPGQADVAVNSLYGGSINLGGRFASQSDGGGVSQVVLGNGQAVLNLVAGGNIVLRAGTEEADAGPSVSETGQEFGEAFVRQTEQTLRQVTDNLEVQLGALAHHLDASLSEVQNGEEIAVRVQEKLQKAMRRAEHKVNQAVRTAERSMARAERRAADGTPRRSSRPQRVPPSPAEPRQVPVGDEERTMILRMVEERKLTVEQAEQLLSAMGAQGI